MVLGLCGLAAWHQFQEDLFKHVLEQTFGTLQFKLGNFDVNLEGDWPRWDYAQVIKDHYGLDPFSCTLEEVKQALKDNKLEVAQTENKARGIDKLWKNVRKDVAGPIWLINTLFVSPLAESQPGSSRNYPARSGSHCRFRAVQPIL